MVRKSLFLILLIVILILLGFVFYFSEFFKVALGMTGNVVKVIG